jgi:hypothetical protein
MVPGLVLQKIVVAKLNTIGEMLAGVDSLALASEEEFTRDPLVDDITAVSTAIRNWLTENPERVDRSL